MTMEADGEIFKIRRAQLWLMCALLALSLFRTLTGKSAELQQLKGHVPAMIATTPATGSLAGTNSLHLAIGLPLRNQIELTNLLRQIYNRSSTNYHQFLTPAQFTERFGPTIQDYQSLVAFATAQGLKITGTSANRTLLDVTAPVSQIEKTFHIKLCLYRNPRESRNFYAPDKEPSVDLALPLLHVSGLDNFIEPQPMCLKTRTPAAKAAGRVWTGSGTNGSYLGADFRKAYAPRSVMTGLGQEVGLLQMESGFFPLDISNYEAQAGLPDIPVTPVLLDGYNGSAGYANDECSLDIEMAISMAPGLSGVLVYEGAVPDDILNQMATDNLAAQLSSSYSFAVDPSTEQIFQQFAAQGQSFFNASGDYNAWVGGVSPPSDDPNITIVGGTSLTTSSNGVWISETVWHWDTTNGSGGGISTQYPIPPWQAGVDMAKNQGSTNWRNIPDVALIADGVYVDFGDGTNGIFGGTSCASPLWAGFTALMNQQAINNGKSPVGFVNPTIYNLGQSPGYASIFHDIVTGDNTNEASDNLFFAVPGYDLCTGWGTPAGQSLIDAMVGPPIPSPAYILTQPTNQSVAAGTNVTLTVVPGGLPPLFCQWIWNGTNINGATNDVLTLNNVQTNEAGEYMLEVSNQFGVAYSSNAILTVSAPPACDPEPIGLASWWSAEGNTDDIINSNNGVANGNLTYAPGKVGQAFVFDGSTSYISIPPSPSLNIGATGTGITLECWISPNDVDVDEYSAPLLEWDSPVAAGLQFWVSSGLYGNIIDTAGNAHAIQTTNGIISADIWQHVALTYDERNGNAAIYLNGAAVMSENFGSIVPQTTYALNIGRRTGQFIGLNDTYNGLMDEISIYNRALAPNEILAIYNAGSEGKCDPVPTPPMILNEPTNETIEAGGNANFGVVAAGSYPLDYQWMFDGTNAITGATNSVLSLTNIQLSAAGFYSVIVSNYLGLVVSSNAQLTVVALAPAIETQPANQTVIQGNTVTFSVLATGSPNLFYQWLFQGITLDGATNSTLLLKNAQPGEAGVYNAVVYNVYGAAVSSNAILTVQTPPEITSQPASQTALLGSNPAFTVAASGSSPLSYQWFFNATNSLVNATNATLTLTNVQSLQAGGYSVQISNAYGQATSSIAVLTFYLAPRIVTQPTNLNLRIGSTATFVAAATGSTNLMYQWYWNAVNALPGATNATLTLTSVQTTNSGNYQVVVTNIAGSATSSNAVLLVNLGYHFTWAAIPTTRFINVPFAVSVQAQTISNTVITNFAGPVSLTTTNGIPVHPAVSGSFVRGSWTGSLSIGETATNLVLKASDSYGDMGLANPLNILAPPVLDQYVSGDSLLLFWPKTIPGFFLVTSPKLDSTNWVPVPDSFEFGNTNINIIDLTGGNAFFRLLYNNP